MHPLKGQCKKAVKSKVAANYCVTLNAAELTIYRMTCASLSWDAAELYWMTWKIHTCNLTELPTVDLKLGMWHNLSVVL